MLLTYFIMVCALYTCGAYTCSNGQHVCLFDFINLYSLLESMKQYNIMHRMLMKDKSD